VAPDQVLADVSSDVLPRQGIDNQLQSGLILSANDNDNLLFEKHNGLTRSKATGWRHSLDNMAIPENTPQAIQVVGIIACLCSSRTRLELL
jgi:hypothetical protein